MRPARVVAVLASVAAALVVAAAFAALLAWGSGPPSATLVLATVPGGLVEMCITDIPSRALLAVTVRK
jgi:uncharacterized membrane protein AbrB (regulator of aidB expression)